VIRDQEIERLFANTLDVFEGMFISRLGLSEEEKAAFEERVFAWFDRFTRRPGNERVPVDRFQIPLLSGTCRLARDIGQSRGVEIPSLSADPEDVARELGLLAGPQQGAPER
jgi:hypothetical protein